MNIYPFEKTTENVFTQKDLSFLQADGLSIRSGNKIIRLQVTEETVIDDQESIRKELEKKFADNFLDLQSQFETYKSQMKEALRIEQNKLKRSQDELEKKMNAISVLPLLTEDHLNQGLSVAVSRQGDGALVWSFKTVYAPKMVGNRRIEPDYAKRLVTPVVLEVRTDKTNKVFGLKVKQYIGDKKFQHYHGHGNGLDCWGQFRFSGRVLNNPDEVITFCKEASFLLEVINDMSIANRSPRGLSRLDTLTKHLLPADAGVPEGNARTNTTNSRNERAGVDTNINSDVSENVWSV